MPSWISRITGHDSNAVFAAVLLAALSPVAVAQRPFPTRPGEEEPKKMPDGRLQSEVILKEDHKKNLEDLGRIRTLVGSIEEDLKKNDRHVLSLKALKDLEEIEKLSRRIRQRMKRY
ncbi:MAG: hypothetical protein HXY18_16810 [Bryobacteraceae bacterium]|nr:hypothetical protein [Bryobacteraceae bacterium]